MLMSEKDYDYILIRLFLKRANLVLPKRFRSYWM